eukprot:152516_1
MTSVTSSLDQIYIFHRFDELIGEYYRLHGQNKYFDKCEQNGRFMQYIIDEEFMDDDIQIDIELGDDALPHDCVYVEFDLEDFPSSNSTYNNNEKAVLIFYFLQYCYKFDSLPTDEYLKRMTNNYLTSIHSIANLNTILTYTSTYVLCILTCNRSDQ